MWLGVLAGTVACVVVLVVGRMLVRQRVTSIRLAVLYLIVGTLSILILPLLARNTPDQPSVEASTTTDAATTTTMDTGSTGPPTSNTTAPPTTEPQPTTTGTLPRTGVAYRVGASDLKVYDFDGDGKVDAVSGPDGATELIPIPPKGEPWYTSAAIVGLIALMGVLLAPIISERAKRKNSVAGTPPLGPDDGD